MLSNNLQLPPAILATGANANPMELRCPVAHWRSCYGKGNILCFGIAPSSRKLESLKVKLESGTASLHLSKFGSDKEQDIGCFLQNTAVLNRSIKWRIFCIQRRCIGGPNSFEPSRGSYKTSYGLQLDSHHRPLRHVVARSDLVKTGTPDAAYSLSAEPNLWPKVRGLCFYAATAVVALCLIGLMLVAHPFVLMFDPYGRRFQHLIARIWATLTVVPFIKVEYEGLENLPRPDTPAVYVSNHQSFLDIYTLLTLGRSFKFISKTSIFLYPVIGWAMSLMGVIPLKRMDSRSQLECLKRCMDLIRQGASVFFFPEGTRSKDGRLGAFKKGAFSVAAKTQVPVVPITLCGTGHIMRVGREGLLYPGTVKVVVHRPFLGNDAEVLCNKSRSVIADTLHHQG